MRKKHPILFGIFLLFCVIAGFSFLVYGISAVSGKKHTFAMRDRVGVVTVEGIIGDSTEVIEQIEDFNNDETIKAVVLRINSPGGSVAPSQEIYEAIVKLKKTKKVVSSMASVAASGGYMIACASDKIVANPGSLTGSISAVMYFANAEELLNKIGLKSTIIKSGKYKDIGSPTRAMTPEEKLLIQALVDDIYDQFLDTVSQSRKISKNDLRKIADGRVFTGRQAKKLGLIDKLGDMNSAVELAGKLSGMQGKPEIVYARKKSPTFLEFILGDVASAIEGKIKSKSQALSGIQYVFMPLMEQL
jgi:protease-4